MINFITGCVMSGKTKLLSNFLYLLKDHEYLLIVPDLIYQNGDSQVKSRCEGYKGFTPNLRANPSTDLFEYVKNKIEENSEIRAIFIEETQFFTREQVDQLQRIYFEFDIKVYCFGISKNHRDENWDTIEYLKQKKSDNNKKICDVLEIATVCNYCSDPATTNIRYDSNFSAKIVDCVNDDKQEKYLPCCKQCHRLRRSLAEINHIN